jgi:hypothetical protein
VVVVTVATPLIVVDMVTIASTVSMKDHVDPRTICGVVIVVAGTMDAGVIGAVRHQFSIEVFHWDRHTSTRLVGIAVLILSGLYPYGGRNAS